MNSVTGYNNNMILWCSPSPVNTAIEIRLDAITNEILRAPVTHPIISTIKAETAIHQGLKLLTVYAKESNELIKLLIGNWILPGIGPGGV